MHDYDYEMPSPSKPRVELLLLKPSNRLRTSFMKNQSLLQQRVLAATSISYIVVILDTSIVNVALERISNALHTHISGLQWVVNAYTLAFACLLLSGGTLGDRWGAR